MRIFGMGWLEILIIVLVIAVLCGPGLFKRLGRRLKKTGDAAKESLEAGAAENGHQIKVDDIKKEDVMGKIEEFQDKIDVKLTEAEKEAEADEKG